MLKKNSYISLKDGFRSVQKKSHYVASSLFPVIISKKNDLNIVFFNYWEIKNKISLKNLRIFTKIYDSSGKLLCHDGNKILKFHNQFSIKNILIKNNIDAQNIKGVVNVEIVSLEKLNFPFPAITGIYNSGNVYSSVHSAGRLKNNSEPQEIMYTEETNWTCKFQKSISPFFHYFVGNKKPFKKYITVKLLSNNNEIKKSKKIFIDKIDIFGSKIFLITDIFKKTKFQNTDFVSVEVEHNSIFPRMIVGNYYSKKNFYEVTHSFPKITKQDYCPVDKKYSFSSKMLAYTNKDLDLKLKIFPTSCKGYFTGDVYVKKFSETSLKRTDEFIDFSIKNLKKENIIRLNKSEEVKSIKLKGNRIPSRLNTSFIYKVRGVKNEYSLDIASGAHSLIFPKKYTHWGHGYVGEGFKSIVMIANDNYEKFNHIEFKGTLDIYSFNFHEKLSVNIKPGSLLTIDIATHKKLKKLKKNKLSFISWCLKLKKPGCECFWVSYRKKDGSIFGDHGF